MMDQLDERITKLENELNHLKQMKEIAHTDSANVQEHALKLYIQLQNVQQVARALNDEGYKVDNGKDGRKYTSNDVSNILNSESIDADETVKTYALEIYNDNFKKVTRRFG
ncbi:MAG: hypothetical protein A4E23_00210 [Methanomethylovorans sp. PtaU1.Bin073]|nr:MAG: hypothetical protein A4E23_00210 [Methanomethylovorans sp. PtaU1.Bin073]